MLLINTIVILIVLIAPTAAVYFPKSSAIASVSTFILTLAMCDNATCCAALLSLLLVIFFLSVEVADPEETESDGQHVTLDGNGHSDATTDKRENL